MTSHLSCLSLVITIRDNGRRSHLLPTRPADRVSTGGQGCKSPPPFHHSPTPRLSQEARPPPKHRRDLGENEAKDAERARPPAPPPPSPPQQVSKHGAGGLQDVVRQQSG